MVKVEPISLEHIEGFREALDSVARERRYLLLLEAPPLTDVADFVRSNVEGNVAQFVALDDGKVVGWCDISPHPRPGMTHAGVLGMGVIAGYRGRGIGYRLLTAAVAKAIANGLTRIELEVLSSNAAALSLYRKFGFEEEGVKRMARCIDGIWDDLVVMSLIWEEGNPGNACDRSVRAGK